MKISFPEAAAFLFGLAALPASAQVPPADFVAPGIVLVEAGIICSADPQSMRPAPDTLAGFINTVDPDVNFVSPSREIPAIVGLRFGVRTMARVRPRPGVTITITHPPMEPEGTTHQSYVITMPVWTRIDGYLFEYERDLVPGDWTISAADGDVTLFTAHFTVVDPAELPELTGLCQELLS